MKHQLFKKGTYVLIETGRHAYKVVGKVKDSTIKVTIVEEDNGLRVPREYIELEDEVLLTHVNPEISSILVRGHRITNAVRSWKGTNIREDKRIIAYTLDLSVPSASLKKEYYQNLQKNKSK
jgi:hypothetical protein